jgi:hypothetical protein
MSLSHLALRLAVIEALAPHAAKVSGAWPTLAGGNVWDSLIGPADATLDAFTPHITVIVDETKTEPRGTGYNADHDGEHTALLAIEIIIPAGGDSEPGATVFEGDGVVEAALNLACEQVHQALRHARHAPLLGDVMLGVAKIETRPWVDADTARRLSARRIEMTCRVPACWPFARADQPLPDPPFANLPHPLRHVAQRLPEGSQGRAICETIDALIRAPGAFPALMEMRLAQNFTRGPGSTVPPPPDASTNPPIGDVTGTMTPNP